MFDLPLTLFNGALCAAAILVAAHLPLQRGRLEAVTLATLLLVLFLVCATGWTGYGRRQAAQIGLSVKEVWTLLDALYGCAAAAIAFRFVWGWLLWAAALAQVAIHYSRMVFGIDPNFYSDALQVVLLGQIGVFFYIGGPGVRDWGNRCVDRLRVSWRSRSTSTTGYRAQQWGDIGP